MRKGFPGLVLTLLVSAATIGRAETIRVYSSAEPDAADQLIHEYEKESGDQIEYVRLSGGEAVTRLRTEANNPQVAMWFVGPATEYAFAAESGLFEKYKPKTGFELPDKYRDKDWRWSGLYLGALAFGSNQKFLKEKNLEPPSSWQDLLKPEYKGKVGFAYPYTSGTALTILLSVVKLMGEPAAMEYFKKLNGQVHQYSKSGSACVNQVGLGEIGVCIAFSQDILYKGIQKGYPIQLSFPKEGTGYEVSSAAIVKGGPGSEKAKKFLDWLYSEKAQTVFETFRYSPLHPKVPIKPPTVRVADLKLVDVDFDWATKNQKTLIAEWRKVTGK